MKKINYLIAGVYWLMLYKYSPFGWDEDSEMLDNELAIFVKRYSVIKQFL